MMKTNYIWDFPLSNHDQSHQTRKQDALDRLKDAKEERMKDRTYRK